MKLTRMTTPWPIYDEMDRHYSHPNGWRIVRCWRDWSHRGSHVASHDAGAGPMTWWEVYPLADSASKRRRSTPAFTADRLRDCRAWCDEHPRWTACRVVDGSG